MAEVRTRRRGAATTLVAVVAIGLVAACSAMVSTPSIGNIVATPSGSQGANVYRGYGRTVGDEVGYVDAQGNVYAGYGRTVGDQVGYVDANASRRLMGGAALLLLLP